MRDLDPETLGAFRELLDRAQKLMTTHALCLQEHTGVEPASMEAPAEALRAATEDFIVSCSLK